MKIYVATIPGEALSVRSQESYYAQQKKLFILLIIVVSIIPLLIISWTSAYFHQRTWRAQTLQSLVNIAESRKDVISQFLKNQENALVALTGLYTVDELRRQGTLDQVFAAINRSGGAVDLGVIDRDGVHVAYVGPYRQQLIGKEYSQSEWFQKVIKDGRYVSDVFQGFREVPHFIVAVAAPDRSWVLRVTIDSDLFNSLLKNTDVGPEGDAFIINQAGQFQTPSRTGRDYLGPEDLALLVDGQSVGHISDQSLFATARLNNGNWLLVLKTDLKKSLAWYYQARNRDWLIISAAAIVILLVASLLTRSMVGKIEKADSQRMILSDRVRQAEKMALIGRLSASVAHEINNPLQIIGDLAGWMEELLDDDLEGQPRNLEEFRSSIGKIRSQVKRASSITHRLLGFCRKESGRVKTDLNQLIDESVSILENEAKKHRIVIRKNLSAEVPPIVTDASQLQQVFLNILDNAIDAIGNDGIVTVSTALADEQIAIEFADTGPGLSKEELSKIFDPFFTTKKSSQGTGLGLWISYNIMQCLRGDIKARNGSIGGSVFRVVLPAPPVVSRTASSNQPHADLHQVNRHEHATSSYN